MQVGWKADHKIPYLDGLRAYSILAVILGHSSRLIPFLQPRWMWPFSFVFCDGSFGVTVFFVLSGFLITTLLLNEWETTGRISISASTAVAWRGFSRPFIPTSCSSLFWICFAASTSRWPALVAAGTIDVAITPNWWPYLDDGHDKGRHLYLWPCVVPLLEEQFYLIWPACLCLTQREGERFAMVSVPHCFHSCAWRSTICGRQIAASSA